MGLIVNQLAIEGIMKGQQTSRIVADVSFSIEKGKKLAMVGESGCGKTMTAMAILGLLPENCTAHGEIFWAHRDLLKLSKAERKKMLGSIHVWIPQSGADFLNPSLTIKYQMKEAFFHGVSESKRDWRRRAEEALRKVGFEDPNTVLKAYPFQLSGGMAQRVILAMAALGKPELVIADEPTRGIDQANIEQFLGHLDSLFPDAAILLITHDISVAAVCDEIIVMNQGKAVELGESSQVLHNPEEAYTRRLICSLPQNFGKTENEVFGC